MTSSAGDSGLIRFRLAAELDDRIAHRREVHDGGHAGEILHDRRGAGVKAISWLGDRPADPSLPAR